MFLLSWDFFLLLLFNHLRRSFNDLLLRFKWLFFQLSTFSFPLDNFSFLLLLLLLFVSLIHPICIFFYICYRLVSRRRMDL